MIRRMLVADRGGAARRILAACRLVGIETVAVYSDADARSPHVAEADWAVHLPGRAPTATYRRRDLLIAAAGKSGADAVHPGWGRLAADPDFAAGVADSGRTWIGPPAWMLAMLLDPGAVAARLAGAGVPVPLRPDDPHRVDGSGYQPARRLDIQVLADSHGNAVPFGERECSIQRRGRPLLAESPSPAVSPELRERLTQVAVRAVTALGCVGAVTAELSLVPDGSCHVLRLRPQLPPEHPVTECVSGLDLVRLQVLIAEGASLPVSHAPPPRGHAITVALRAEDPAYAWHPSAGRLQRFRVGPVGGEFRPLAAPGLRVDAGVTDGAEVSAHYDAALATVTAWAPTRYEAARLLAVAMSRAQVHGVTTNRDLLVRVLRHPGFLGGAVDTNFVSDHPELLAPLMSAVDSGRLSCLAAALAAAAARRAQARVLGSLAAGWRNVPAGVQTTVYAGPMGTVEIGYRLDRTGELESWWVRAVDPAELDLAGLGQPSSPPDDRPPVALVSSAPDRVVLDAAGVRVTFSVHRDGDVSYVDSPEGSVVLTEVARYPVPVYVDETPD